MPMLMQEPSELACQPNGHNHERTKVTSLLDMRYLHDDGALG